MFTNVGGLTHSCLCQLYLSEMRCYRMVQFTRDISHIVKQHRSKEAVCLVLCSLNEVKSNTSVVKHHTIDDRKLKLKRPN